MKLLITLLILLYSSCACSAIQIERSRVIYSGDHKSAALEIHNESKDNYIVQSWLDDDAGKSEKTMVVTPPLLKLLPDQSATLRFVYSGSGLPADRESVIWVNVQEIPPRAKEPNVMQLAVRTRLKLFYRPVALRTTLKEEVQKLKINALHDGIVINNNGPMHISLGQLTIRNASGKEQTISAPMISPFSQANIPFQKGSRVVSLTYINDYGGVENLNL